MVCVILQKQWRTSCCSRNPLALAAAGALAAAWRDEEPKSPIARPARREGTAARKARASFEPQQHRARPCKLLLNQVFRSTKPSALARRRGDATAVTPYPQTAPRAARPSRATRRARTSRRATREPSGGSSPRPPSWLPPRFLPVLSSLGKLFARISSAAGSCPRGSSSKTTKSFKRRESAASRTQASSALRTRHTQHLLPDLLPRWLTRTRLRRGSWSSSMAPSTRRTAHSWRRSTQVPPPSHRAGLPRAPKIPVPRRPALAGRAICR